MYMLISHLALLDEFKVKGQMISLTLSQFV